MDIDAALAAAISAAPPDDPHGWFAAVRETYDQFSASGEEVSLAGFAHALAARVGEYGFAPETATQFADYLEAYDPAPLNTIARMCALGDALPAAYQQLAQGGDVAGATAEPAQDGTDAAWNAFLAEHGPRWDGEESSWEAFKQWFLYQADQGGVAIPANSFVIYVENQADKAAVFAQYGVTIASSPAAATTDATEAAPVVDTSAFPPVQEGDSGEWVKYLDEMLKSSGY